ncbi:TioE family transcriptional regulator [Actinokineospora auranticolor]|uniref:DNA-binding transcriptional MerR regulator n=1 Tax=Actinokineospora auranticolor TaxID=155976 RepID=A0A2S6H0E4_9PSEU|nr:TioE family transcriptional regulator [Actinokineospora auranticolor]PPK70949.1 DNA-binding transcriptional MerR regulator [Actinokineospora auranticolor]
MSTLRPADLAREHGLSTQAVRNYERDGFLPPADRTPTGYRVYTPRHAAALRAYLALIPAHGHRAAGQVMTAVHDNDLDRALTLIDRGHTQLLNDRETLASVREAIAHLPHTPLAAGSPRTIGELAHRLGVTPATLRNWESAGILTPTRTPTGHRLYHPTDTRDADLTHLLRRGGYPLDRVATVIHQIRTAGGTDALSSALADWQQSLTTRSLAMLRAAGQLDLYLAHPSSGGGYDLAVGEV